ncbi:MAG TPA: hypothetical protein VN679_07850 [Candidatus Acidoferrales bacterium]|nr:hypothetical protein [Candidatus Acidoferrales bacterium]
MALAVSPEMLAQQTSGQTQSTAPQSTQPQNGQPAPPNQTQPSGGAINPSQPPLQPVTTYPNASDTQQDEQQATPPEQNQNTANPPEAPQPKQQPSQPVGAATAERVPTAGGAAAKPAGAAIAPAKQHQTRSLLIKIGAIAAAGAAVGTIYALSRGTSSTPPNAGGGIPK